jgi:transposase-like protein
LGIKTRINSDGLMEGYDEATGKVEWVEKARKKKPGAPRRTTASWSVDQKPVHKVKDPDGKLVWAYMGVNLDHIPREVWPYSRVMIDHVCALVAEGHTISKIARMEGLPPLNTLYRWRREHPEFREELKEARKMRAEIMHDKVLELADTTEKETVMEDRLKKEIYQWGAEKGDPDEYGVRVKSAVEVSAPGVWIIQTGVPTQAPPIEVKSEPAPPIELGTQNKEDAE